VAAAARTGRRWLYRGGRRATIALCCLLTVICGAAAVIGYSVATAQPVIPGKAIDAGTAQTISLAALSCPTLSGPRLAGQIMANSGFDPNVSTANGGTGVAGMSAATFQQWAPWPQATPADAVADIYALAHYDCNLIGQLRQAKVPGDPWDNALAAFQVGADAVVKAAAVPSTAQTYVDTVGGYAAWYAQQPVFTGAGPSGTASPGGAVAAMAAAAAGPSTTPVQPVPDSDVPAVLAAGGVCAQISPARVAAQLMASSAFNPNLRGADGTMGIAQFPPDLWSQYASASDSPWDPATAIRTLGHAMCDLVRQLGALAKDRPLPAGRRRVPGGADRGAAGRKGTGHPRPDGVVRVAGAGAGEGDGERGMAVGVVGRSLGDGYRAAGPDLQHAQRSPEEPARCVGVAAGRDQHVDDLCVVVDRPR
jgi:hypothetical protein